MGLGERKLDYDEMEMADGVGWGGRGGDVGDGGSLVDAIREGCNERGRSIHISSFFHKRDRQ